MVITMNRDDPLIVSDVIGTVQLPCVCNSVSFHTVCCFHTDMKAIDSCMQLAMESVKISKV